MDWRIFIQRNLKFGKRLKRLHHSNAILFLLLTISGFTLFSISFRSAFPAVRVWVKDGHVWIGILSCLPLLFYLPKMTRHLKSLQKRINHRLNLYFILTIITLLTVSGLLLTFQRQFPPNVSTFALFIHDLSTYVGVPYLVYHSVTRSRWFKRLVKTYQQKEESEEPLVIDKYNPIYKRRTFLRVATGSAIAIIFAPLIINWLKPYLPSFKTKILPKTNHFKNLPQPNPKSSPPMGGGRRGQFRYYTVTEVPNLNDENFYFKVDGFVKHPINYNWNEFVNLNRTVQVSDFHCVTGWSVNKITWEGIPLKTLLRQVGIQRKAKYVKFYSADGVYTDTLTLKQAMLDDVMVAVLIDGQLIDQNNGGPTRLIVPKMYGYKSVKWLNRVELIDQEQVGYWEKRGYSKNAWVKHL